MLNRSIISSRALVVLCLAGLLILATMLALGGFFSFGLSPFYFYALVVLDGGLIFYVGRLVWRKIFLGSHKRIMAPLQKRITILFSLLSLIPATVVIILAIVFFNYGMQDWFQGFVQTSIEESLVVARSYLEEHKSLVGRDARLMAQDILSNWSKFPRGEEGKEMREEYLNAVCAMRSFSELLMFNEQHDVVGKASLTFALEFEPIPVGAIDKAMAGEVVVLTSVNNERVRALVNVEVEGQQLYLFVGRPIDKNVLMHLEKVDKSVSDYEVLLRKRVGLQIIFVIVFLMVSCVLLLTAVWLGMTYADKLTRPMRFLINYAERLASGQTTDSLEMPQKDDELYSLNNSLRRMLQTIQSQRQDVMQAQRSLEVRNAFISRTLQGVRSGVMRVDHSYNLIYYNSRAAEILRVVAAAKGGGVNVAQALPMLAPLMSPENFSGNASVSSEVTIERKVLRVCVVLEQDGDDSVQGYIITLEDITQLLSAQKQAAWADVARRVAHEVKNPLTPITLCVERLRTKYNDLDQSMIERYVDTIQKQVATIQNLIDGFASFGRWPAPKKTTTDLLCIMRQSIVALGSVYPNVAITVESGDRKSINFWADPAQIGQLFQNIIKNACEAIIEKDRPQKTIDISFDIIDEGGRLLVIFEDSGGGFDPEVISRVTKSYVTTRAQGSGLGLAICRKVTEDHGGEISIKNTAHGALITLSFPIEG